ncbi:uncharacterized protein at4g06598 [Phtheirospermum japonicum]|uniref:Uncharacterized protein at4g06598 n=1 Tax=Phtheirospermum japonicum TaxID=374723 RepID=A0A830CYZ4_9LAMI|nr:uncharacterized protein at4g06598 [Phtheirospermum japonicum]
MDNSKGSSNSIRSTMHNGKNSLLPPKSPYPCISPSYSEYIPRSGPRPLPKPRNGNPHHQRTSSESFLDEQPSWLDELLDEPDTPVRRGGHRRSSSDSFAYTDNYNIAQDYDNKIKNVTTTTPLSSSWGSQDVDFYRDANHCGKIMNKPWDAPLSLISPPRGFNSHRDNGICLNSGSVGPSQDADRNLSYSDVESGPQDPKGFFDKKDHFHETDTKRSKQQYAQRSRVRKLQYIAELERNVQALQASSEASAELEFLNNQNLILSLENKALKQRLENLSQEQLIKYFEHEVLEKEAGRLRSLYQQQQQPPQQQLSSGHRRAKSRDIDQQFANLSLKQKETSAGGQDSISSQLHF